MKRALRLVRGAFTLAVFAQTAFAQDFERGVAAYDAGDYETALVEWLPLVEQDDAKAQYMLSMMYLNGQGVKKDLAEALRLLRISAEQGYSDAQVMLGGVYEQDPQYVAEAVKLYHLAAEQGNIFAQNNLAMMYAEGRGVPKNHAEAIRLFRLVAERGEAVAQNNLGTMYAKGDGIPQDYVLAYMWFNLAAASMDAAKSSRDHTAGKLTPELLAEAQRMSRLCLESNYKSCGY